VLKDKDPKATETRIIALQNFIYAPKKAVDFAAFNADPNLNQEVANHANKATDRKRNYKKLSMGLVGCCSLHGYTQIISVYFVRLLLSDPGLY